MQKLQVKFELINDAEKKIHGYLPEKTTSLATGFDVRNAGENLVLKPFEYAKIALGFRCLIPSEFWFFLVPRSSTFGKKHMHALYGTIDADFESAWFFAAQYVPENDLSEAPYLGIAHGDRIAQIILLPRYDFEPVLIDSCEFAQESMLRASTRGSGFGSSGDK
jgi:dUTPase